MVLLYTAIHRIYMVLANPLYTCVWACVYMCLCIDGRVHFCNSVTAQPSQASGFVVLTILVFVFSYTHLRTHNHTQVHTHTHTRRRRRQG